MPDLDGVAYGQRYQREQYDRVGELASLDEADSVGAICDHAADE